MGDKLHCVDEMQIRGGKGNVVDLTEEEKKTLLYLTDYYQTLYDKEYKVLQEQANDLSKIKTFMQENNISETQIIEILKWHINKWGKYVSNICLYPKSYKNSIGCLT